MDLRKMYLSVTTDESTEAAINLKRARVVREDPTPHR